MLNSKTYKLFPAINNSFDETLKLFTEFLISKYEVLEIKYSPSIIIDNTKVGSSFHNMTKPTYIYITVNFNTKSTWTNRGGITFCEIKTPEYKIDVKWQTSKPYMNDIAEEISIKFFRNLKLQKLNEKAN
jgi:hypothetical protein